MQESALPQPRLSALGAAALCQCPELPAKLGVLAAVAWRAAGVLVSCSADEALACLGAWGIPRARRLVLRASVAA